MSLRLSFIVPFYNVELYIEECIRSLYAQDIPWEEYEVICVDDCSPDGSRAIVERLQKEYPTLKLLTTPENLRQGGARNLGLDVAQGKYIWFVDSDDYIFPNIMERLFNEIETNSLEVLQFDYIQGEYRSSGNMCLNNILCGEKYLFEDSSSEWTHKIVGPWRQLYSRSFVDKINLRFIEKAAFEDTDFVLQSFLLAERVQHISIDVYHYRINTESVTIAPVVPMKLAWRVHQLVRCSQLIDLAKSLIAKEKIQELVSNSLSQLRKEIKHFSADQKYEYIKYLKPSIKVCRPFMSWRTWLAIRYAITWFI